MTSQDSQEASLKLHKCAHYSGLSLLFLVELVLICNFLKRGSSDPPNCFGFGVHHKIKPAFTVKKKERKQMLLFYEVLMYYAYCLSPQMVEP